MAEFDENKVINELHTDKVEIGKKYIFADYLSDIKKYVESDEIKAVGVLVGLEEDDHFIDNEGISWNFCYPYEEPPKRRMTNRQLSEWLLKGNGEYVTTSIVNGVLQYLQTDSDRPVGDSIRIRVWDSDEWVIPTEEIYMRDCI